MIHSWCPGETRERGGEGWPEGEEASGGDGGGFAAMATDAAGSKQMSTSWQSGSEWSKH